jgi:hypothetical protein
MDTDDPTAPSANLNHFAATILAAPLSPAAEAFLRKRLARYAESCPLALAVRLGEVVLGYRAAELRDEAARN